jgi:hypothetical protein
MARVRVTIDELTFFSEEINTRNWLLDRQAFLHFARFDIPEPNGLVVTSTDQPLAAKEQSCTEVGMAGEEPDGLR